MAVKDHSLDDKIVKAAQEEFLENGYSKASLHKIAQKAGITTGALYTRYKGKDDLFCSLLEGIFTVIKEKSKILEKDYMSVMKNDDPVAILSVIKEEEKIYIDLLFDHYDSCLLLFCKSDGSSVQKLIDEMMEKKAESTVQYLKSIAKKEINLDGIALIMEKQFSFFRCILEKGYTREKAVSCMESIEDFLDAGWKDLFERML